MKFPLHSRARLLLAITGMAAGVAFARDAMVRTSLEDPGPLWVGQRATLAVDLLAPGYFSGTPSFILPEVPGLLFIPPADSPTVGSEQIDGVSCTTLRHEVSVFAQRAGTYTIPAFSIRLSFKRNPLDPQPVAQTVHSSPITLTARMPPGAEKLGSMISSTRLTATEMWSPPGRKAKVGDAFTHTITFTARNVPGMAFPPFPTPPVDGLGIYPKAPQVNDETNRGELEGQRIETAVYVCERAGHFVVPGARWTWWNLDSMELQTVDFPARTFDIAPNPALARPPVAGRTPFPWKALAATLLVAILAAILVSTRRLWAPSISRTFDHLRPIHLAPLNPTDRTSTRS